MTTGRFGYPGSSASTAMYAPIWRRIAAYVIDSLFLALLNFAMFLIIRQIYDASGDAGVTSVAILASKILAPLFYVGYFLFFFSTSGRTIGARFMGIRIERVHASLNLWSGLLRLIGFFISSILFCLGLLWALWDPRRQTWHDKLANTVVVRT